MCRGLNIIHTIAMRHIKKLTATTNYYLKLLFSFAAAKM